jgi:hypothetical protein
MDPFDVSLGRRIPWGCTMKRHPPKSVSSTVLLTKWLPALTVGGLAFAQLPQSQLSQAQAPSSITPPDKPVPAAVGLPPPAKGLTVKEKFKYDARHLFDVDNIVFAAMGAGLDQLRDRPGEWGQGWDAYGHRFESHLGQYAIQRSIMFGVQAVDHEDTRYFRSKKKTLGGRLGDAIFHTVWRHDDSGGMMPAYSEFFGDYGAAAISREWWWPQRYHNASAIFIAGSDTVAIDAGINVLHEFAPDVKRWLHLSRLPAGVTDRVVK